MGMVTKFQQEIGVLKQASGQAKVVEKIVIEERIVEKIVVEERIVEKLVDRVVEGAVDASGTSSRSLLARSLLTRC